MTYYFSLLLVIATVFTGIIWAIDHWVWKPRRQEKIKAIEEKTGKQLTEDEAHKVAPQSSLAEFSQSAFPIIAIVLILRSFIYEPFRIPSGSMMPVLLEGDFILVEKFRYGLRDPVFRKEFIRTSRPERGDIAVFKFPLEPDLDYIKRVIGMPGDRVVYEDKTFYIYEGCGFHCDENAEPVVVEHELISNGEFYRDRQPQQRYRESLDGRSYDILIDPSVNSRYGNYARQDNTQRNEWVVPEGHYFMVGDNRDNSIDSRYWGFVQEDLLVGRAVAVWLSLEFERPRDSLIPGWIPSRLRFERLGGIE